ncbi:MAG: cytochrome c oxidase assembly protein [Caldilineaceae bacterium]
MSIINWVWPITVMILLGLTTMLYWRGWRKLRVAFPYLAERSRLAAFLTGVILLILATVAPLMDLSQHYLFARALQKVFLGMLAPSLLWLSCPIHTIVWGLPTSLRRRMARRLFFDSHLRGLLQPFIQPGLSWLFFVITFSIWHEPHYLTWTMQTAAAHYFSVIWLFGAALLYWSHIMYTGLRTHTRLSGWFVFVYLLGVEIPNMFVGVSMAFSSTPLYEYYVQLQNATGGDLQNVLRDQMLSGGLIWVIGSFVYISTIVLVFNRLFKLEQTLPPMLSPDREADERWIAPGLEYRVVQNRWRQLQSEKQE